MGPRSFNHRVSVGFVSLRLWGPRKHRHVHSWSQNHRRSGLDREKPKALTPDPKRLHLAAPCPIDHSLHQTLSRTATKE